MQDAMHRCSRRGVPITATTITDRTAFPGPPFTQVARPRVRTWVPRPCLALQHPPAPSTPPTPHSPTQRRPRQTTALPQGRTASPLGHLLLCPLAHRGLRLQHGPALSECLEGGLGLWM